MRIIPRDVKFKTFPVPETNLDGEVYMRRRPNADWRLICIPGAPSHTHLFRRLLQLAPDSLEVFVVNRLGYGANHDEAVLDFNEQIKIVEPLLKDKRVILLGASYGGALSLNAALKYRGKVEGVVTSAALIQEPRDYAKTMVDFDIPAIITENAPKKLQRMRAEIHGRRPQIGPLLDRVNQLDIPIEVLHGTLDTLVSRDDAEHLIKVIGDNARYKEITGGTHYIELQFPQQIFKAVNRLKKRIEARV